MKKIILMFMIFILPETISAQSVEIGILGAINFSDLATDGLDFKPNVGFQVGFSTNFIISESVVLKTGLSFKQKYSNEKSNAVLEDSNGNVTRIPTNTKFQMPYIQLPVFFEYRLKNNFGFYAGPVIEYRVGGSAKVEGIDWDLTESADLNDFDYGVAIALNYTIKKSTFGIEFNHNFNNVLSPEPGLLGPNIFNSLSLIYIFRLN